MRKEFEGFEGFGSIEKNAPKELVREDQTPDGKKVREVGPIVYGYSMTIGPDGKPKVREFGNIHHLEKEKESDQQQTDFKYLLKENHWWM